MMDINPRNGDFCVLFKSHSKKNIFVEIKTTHFQIIQSSDTHRFYKAYSSQKSMIYKHRVSLFSGKQKQTTDNKLIQRFSENPSTVHGHLGSYKNNQISPCNNFDISYVSSANVLNRSKFKFFN